MEHLAFFLNEPMPGVAKDIRSLTHAHYIVSTVLPQLCLEHFVSE